MPRSEIPIVVFSTTTGQIATNGTCRIRLRGTTTDATVYAAQTGTTTVSQPLTIGSRGEVDGWLDYGEYDAVISVSGEASVTRPFDVIPPARYFCSVTHNGTPATDLDFANDTEKTLPFNADRLDPYDMHAASGGAPTNQRIVLPVSGIWLITACVEWAPNATGRRYLFITKNGTYQGGVSWPATATGAMRQSVTWQDSYAANDYVELLGRQNSGGTLGINVAAYSPILTAVHLSSV